MDEGDATVYRQERDEAREEVFRLRERVLGLEQWLNQIIDLAQATEEAARAALGTMRDVPRGDDTGTASALSIRQDKLRRVSAVHLAALPHIYCHDVEQDVVTARIRAVVAAVHDIIVPRNPEGR